MTDCLHEETILRFVEGRLDAGELAAVEAHARACPRCQELLSAGVAAAAPLGAITARLGPAPETREGDLPRGTALGRYTVLALIGRGGMGEVYAAYDPELDRKIALKLLRPRDGDSSGGESRLLREARATASLSHPNVITVHDVGTLGDRVFLAMEHVDGVTLAAWLAEPPRSRAEILEVFREAARGLGAAHAAGLVHRDFKPQNVMVGRDGTVRVMDFGLARRIAGAPAAHGTAAADAGPARPPAPGADGALSASGDLAGTPLYMAPEQFADGPSDARTDQFSFCVALYRALYGAHPFALPGELALPPGVSHGPVKPPPARSSVPAWLRRVLLRGLALAPADRWPSMGALSEALARDPAGRRRRWALAAGAALALAAAVLGVARSPRARAVAPCQGGPARLADAWAGAEAPADARRETLRRAFLASGLPYASETWDKAAALLDRYAAGWLRAYREACEATHVRGEQSSEILDLRMACLEDRRAALAALGDVLATADRLAVAAAVDAAAALPALETCGDVRLLRAEGEPPRDPATRARVDDLRRRAAAARAAYDTGRTQPAVDEARRLVAEARTAGYAPVLAEMLLLLGSFRPPAGATDEAVRTLEEATLVALRSRRDDVAAQAAAELAAAAASAERGPAEGERWADMAEALLDRIGVGQERVRAQVLQTRAVAREATDPTEALRLARQALVLRRRALPPDHPDIGESLVTEAECMHRTGDDAGALAMSERAIDVLASAYGRQSPRVARALGDRGTYLLALGRAQEAPSAPASPAPRAR
jgi:hypothetical protein